MIESILNDYKNSSISTNELKKRLRKYKTNRRIDLSCCQKGIWLNEKRFPGTDKYILPFCFKINRPLNKDVLKEAFENVILEFPILRSSLCEENGKPFFRISDNISFDIDTDNIGSDSDDKIIERILEEAYLSINPEKGALIDIKVYNGVDRSFMLLRVHHIIFDGTSVVIFIDRLFDFYSSLLNGEECKSGIPAADYSEFVEWERKMLNGEEGKKLQEYWSNRLSIPPSPAMFPTDHITSQNTTNGVERIVIDRDFFRQLTELIHSKKLSNAVFFLGVLNILLWIYTGEEDIITGVVSRNRPLSKFEGSIGCFINMLPVRTAIEPQSSVSGYLDILQERFWEDLENSTYPYSEIVKSLKLSGKANDLFKVGFFYQNYALMDDNSENKKYKGLFNVENICDISQKDEYPITLEILEYKERIELFFKFDNQMYKSSSIRRIANNYLSVLKQILQNSEKTLCQLERMSESEYNTVIYDFNDTYMAYPADKNVYELFEKQALKTPSSIAIEYGNERFTYKEVKRRSSVLASYLRKKGVENGTIVGLYMDRTPDMIISMLAVQKADGIYIPLDPIYPKDRLQYMADDSGMSYIISNSATAGKNNALLSEIDNRIIIDEQWEDIEKTVGNNTEISKTSGPDDGVYILYTSGSTGNPKGVKIKHKGLTNFICSMADKLEISSKDKILALTTFCFDISGLEIYVPLIKGAVCSLLSTDKQRNMELLKKEISIVKPTLMQATPSTWNALFLLGWKNQENIRILCGGEALNDKLRTAFIDNGCEVWNMYGPTETTIWSTMKLIKDNEKITVGKPIWNTQCYILDKYMKPVPIGAAGELYISGEGVAEGYYNRKELTNERFLNDCFRPGNRMYKTGDLVRWNDDGEIEYLRRNDDQIKIRGYRIEIGEIEKVLNGFPGIKESVVTVGENGYDKTLRAFYITEKKITEKLNTKNLRTYLKASLPDYMVPVEYIEIEKFPMTPNGKINRNALQSFNILHEEKEHIHMEERIDEKPNDTVNTDISDNVTDKLTEIFSRHLNHSDFGYDDGFFDIGGDSLSVVSVVQEINNEFRTNITVTEFFNNPSISMLSPIIDGNTVTENNKKNSSESKNSGGFKGCCAVIGMSCEAPGAKSYRELWNRLVSGEESQRFLSKEEMINVGVPEELIDDPEYVPVQLFCEDKEMFDNEFFRISPKEAETMNPQMRRLLQASWKAVEDAGYTPDNISDASVYMSASNNFYNSSSDVNGLSIVSKSEDYVSWLYGQPGTLPTLISYKLGLTGPSCFIHTNCSSGLSGLYHAYQDISRGRVDHALVGASSLRSLPDAGYVHVKGLNFSSDGHIRAFDSEADGMVGSEGTVVLLLKNAEKAVSDGDHIYAIIRGAELNNDGADKAGFYAPSARRQADLIYRAIRGSNVDPESIRYIEAHGTGTKIGDPIEFSALASAFRKYTDKKQFCGIGSIKTNIGHLDSAAGLISCVKVCLSLKNGVIPATLNYKSPNPEIDLEDSPFYILSENQIIEDDNSVFCAAVSSFGIGGTNGHIIFEKYNDCSRTPQNDINRKFIIPLSAKSSNALNEYVSMLLSTIKADAPELCDIAYTLQNGRVEMNERVAFVAESLSELEDKLRRYTFGDRSEEVCKTGSITTRKRKNISVVGKELYNINNTLELAEKWTEGCEVDWKETYSSTDMPRRISLPGYPFVNKLFRRNENDETCQIINRNDRLHYLIDKNVSTLLSQSYIKIFDGSEFYLKDHIINDKTVLPGVIYLEMAREACELAMMKRVARLENVVWMAPMKVEDPVEARIYIIPSDGSVHYTISSNVVHSQGSVIYGDEDEEMEERFDVEACINGCISRMSHEEFYGVKNTVYNYGKTFRPIITMNISESYVLAEINIPKELQEKSEKFVLHPSLLEGCLQSSVVLMKKELTEGFMPFAIEAIEIIHEIPKQCYVYAEVSDNTDPKNGNIKFNIYLMDMNGKIVLRIKNYSVRNIKVKHDLTADMSGSRISFRYSELIRSEPDNPLDKELKNCVVFGNTKGVFPDGGAVTVLPGRIFRCSEKGRYEINVSTPNHYSLLFDSLLAEGRTVERIIINWLEENIDNEEALKRGAYALLSIIRSVAAKKEKLRILIVYRDADSVCSVIYQALIGMIKTISKEYGNISVKLININTDKVLLREIAEYEFCNNDDNVCYTDNGRYVYVARELDIQGMADTYNTPFRENGVYIITGGGGKLAGIIAGYLAEKYKAAIVLIGRSEEDQNVKKTLDHITQSGGKAVYYKADVCDQRALKRVTDHVFSEFGTVHGVLHCAGSIRDSLIVNKTVDEMDEVILPKVEGAIYLDNILKDVQLDMFVMFSSVSSDGSAGQADYAYANSFLNSFARYRGQLEKKSQRFGKTVSICWPLWMDGGMTISDKMIERMKNTMNMLPLSSDEGIMALEKAIIQPHSCIYVNKEITVNG